MQHCNKKDGPCQEIEIKSQHKTAVVTGASSGMGLSIARELAKRNYRLILSSRNPHQAAEDIENEFGVEVNTVAGSIADPKTSASIAEVALSFGNVQSLLLNHGGPPVIPLMDISDEQWNSAFEMMVAGPLRVMRAVVPIMREAQIARILAISSFTVKAPWEGIGLSNSLRAALVNALKTAAIELGPEGILVNALAPGYVETDRIRDWNTSFAKKEGVDVDEIRDRTLETIPLRRYGTPEGYARMAAFLLSEENDYISGQQILYDGALVTAN